MEFLTAFIVSVGVLCFVLGGPLRGADRTSMVETQPPREPEEPRPSESTRRVPMKLRHAPAMIGAGIAVGFFWVVSLIATVLSMITEGCQ
jgi:hypothetical protein